MGITMEASPYRLGASLISFAWVGALLQGQSKNSYHGASYGFPEHLTFQRSGWLRNIVLLTCPARRPILRLPANISGMALSPLQVAKSLRNGMAYYMCPTSGTMETTKTAIQSHQRVYREGVVPPVGLWWL